MSSGVSEALSSTFWIAYAGAVVNHSGACACWAVCVMRARTVSPLRCAYAALVTTNAAGRFSYPGLGPGRYTVTAKKGGEVSQNSDPVRVDEGGKGEAFVVLDPGVTMTITVVDEGEAEIRARISVTDSEGREVSGMLSLSEIMEAYGRGFSSTAQEVGPLPPGKYRVTALLDDGRETHKNITLSRGQEERKVKLRVK